MSEISSDLILNHSWIKCETKAGNSCKPNLFFVAESKVSLTAVLEQELGDYLSCENFKSISSILLASTTLGAFLQFGLSTRKMFTFENFLVRACSDY